MKFSINLFLILIAIFFFTTRFYKISEIPPSVYWDEVSIGYNAYSVSKDGKDEWGEFLPIHFRAFGEFKLPVYIYSVVPFVKTLGLNEFSVRIPAVLFSLGVVILVYFLAKKVSGSKSLGLWSSFFVSISPWFFIFSRTGYEATAGLAFYLLGIYLFLRIEDNKWLLFFSIASFILSAYSYNSFRITVPLSVLLLIFFERGELKRNFSKIISPLILSVVILITSVIPIYRLYKYDVGNFRFQAVGVKSESDFFKNYLSHFSFNFLFISGDKNLRSQQANFGQLYLPDVILIIFGLLYIIGSNSKYKWMPLALLFLGPIPAALTKESPHALRALSSVPFYSMLSAYGIIYFKSLVKLKYLEIIIAIFFLGLFIRYFVNFLNVYPADSAKDWQYEYKKIFTISLNKYEQNGKFLIPDKYGQPYIFALFYLKYDPERFRREVLRNPVDKWGFSTVKSFGKFDFVE